MLGKFPVPVEVIKFAEALVAKKIAAMGAGSKCARMPPAASSSPTKAITFLIATSDRFPIRRRSPASSKPPPEWLNTGFYWDGEHCPDRKRNSGSGDSTQGQLGGNLAQRA